MKKVKKIKSTNFIILVSGLPRSGTSLMMQILEAGGVKILTDKIRKPDQDNPKGYYEFEKVKEIKKNKSWFKQARGKAVKIVSPLLKHLPQTYDYKIIFMERKIEEILASQQAMLKTRKEKSKTSDQKMKKTFQKHLKEVKNWLKTQKNMKAIFINYNQMFNSRKKELQKLAGFLNLTQISKMERKIRPELYRQRKN